jgi:hypothetical protein
MASRLLMIVALVAAAYGADAAQDKPAPKRSSPAATERAKPEQKKPEPTLEERALADRDAQYDMGERLRLGNDGPVDLPMALMWYFRAAEQGHQGARARVAEITKPYAAVEPRAVSEPAPASARDREPPIPAPQQTPRDYLALALALVALVVSATAIVISWNRTNKALRDAGLQ